MTERERRLPMWAQVLIRQLRIERRLLARLASDRPEFFNPIAAWEAIAVRDRVLGEQEAPR